MEFIALFLIAVLVMAGGPIAELIFLLMRKHKTPK